jgi:plastocyanin
MRRAGLVGRVAALSAAACAIGLAMPAVAAESDVEVGSFKFAPASVTVQQGDAVTWSWAGPDVNHTITSDPGQADSFESHPTVATSQVTGPPPGGTYSHTFTTPGSFTYFCRVHPSMQGKVVVTPAAPGAAGQGGGPAAQGTPGAAGHPTFKECLSQRNFIIRLRQAGGVHLKSADVKVNGKAVEVVPRKIDGRRRLTARVDLRGLPSGQYTVDITAKTSKGGTLHGQRLYRTCSKRVPSYILPKL